ncbi:heparan-alpha-glucosaminide N-acetyltransferase [Roseateles sp. BYS180W]|uniref:Heparan-alpha-glucosaminide N-acetyltransferase n=1 Tax=Roseateles rivi TaxID=3299028 RepID=A0ABW7FZD9_9BURK
MQGQRFERLDALRGLAMLWMTGFHFCFDLVHFGLWRQDFYRDPLWTWQRVAIVSSFLLCAGLGQGVAVAQGQSLTRFARRWAQVAAAALLVSVGSWWVFPQSYIYFGVLHGMAAMLLLLRLGLLRLPTPVLLALALAALLAPPLWAAWGTTALDGRGLNALGLISRKPVTEDYVPVLPWLSVLLLGFVLARQGRVRAWLAAPLPRAGHALAGLGRWSLSYYLLHQPLLMGLLWLVLQLGARP